MRIWALSFVLLAGCGPQLEPVGSSGADSQTGSGGGTTAAASSGGSQDADSDTTTSGTPDDPDEGERYDLARAPDLYLPASCLAPLRSGGACDTSPEPDDEIPVDRWSTSLRVREDGLELGVGSSQSLATDYLWFLEVALPCPSAIDGVPEGGVDARFVAEATVAVSVYGGFRYSPQGEFAATVDLELLDDCVHVRLHDVRIDDPEYDENWPVMPPLGVFRAEPLGT